mmetsp:Transcript_51431/g.92672  ORF Transcript_51431/g.92672 Transcript_51431/m.92672 type:complete len:400 (-) Transcript_51431:52-1251(-)
MILVSSSWGVASNWMVPGGTGRCWTPRRTSRCWTPRGASRCWTLQRLRLWRLLQVARVIRWSQKLLIVAWSNVRTKRMHESGPVHLMVLALFQHHVIHSITHLLVKTKGFQEADAFMALDQTILVFINKAEAIPHVLVLLVSPCTHDLTQLTDLGISLSLLQGLVHLSSCFCRRLQLFRTTSWYGVAWLNIRPNDLGELVKINVAIAVKVHEVKEPIGGCLCKMELLKKDTQLDLLDHTIMVCVNQAKSLVDCFVLGSRLVADHVAHHLPLTIPVQLLPPPQLFHVLGIIRSRPCCSCRLRPDTSSTLRALRGGRRWPACTGRRRPDSTSRGRPPCSGLRCAAEVCLPRLGNEALELEQPLVGVLHAGRAPGSHLRGPVACPQALHSHGRALAGAQNGS